jgi:rod shape-determining protein MreB
MDEAIIEHLKRSYNLMIGERTAEDIKLKIGSAFPMEEEMTMEVKGRDLVAGLPKTMTISSEEVRDSLSETINAIIDTVKLTLERTPPELSSDIVDRGIVLAGGGALLRGIDKLIAQETGLPVTIAEDPLTAIVMGTGKIVEEIDTYKRILSSNIPEF